MNDRQLARRALGLCLCVGTLCARVELSRAASPDSASVERADTERSAKQAFDQGLALVHKERFREAIAEFETAYSLKPHYAVLYNISQCYLQLGELEPALKNLERYLAEGAASISEPLRVEREQQLAALKARQEEERVREQPVIAVPVVASLPELLPDVQGRSDVEPAPLAQQAPAEQPKQTEAGPNLTAVAVTGVTGLALVGTSAGLWIWNQQRLEQWERTDDELAAYRSCYPHCAPPDDFNTRQTENNDLSDSIQHFQVVAISTGVLGLGLLGASAYLVATGDEADAPSTALSLAPGFVSVTRAW